MIEFRYKFFGVTVDGKREIIGTVSATGMVNAFELIAAVARHSTLPNYPRIEVERIDRVTP